MIIKKSQIIFQCLFTKFSFLVNRLKFIPGFAYVYWICDNMHWTFHPPPTAAPSPPIPRLAGKAQDFFFFLWIEIVSSMLSFPYNFIYIHIYMNIFHTGWLIDSLTTRILQCILCIRQWYFSNVVCCINHNSFITNLQEIMLISPKPSSDWHMFEWMT